MSDIVSIVVAGSINVDYVLRTPHIPLAGETVSGGEFAIFGGGKGANQAVACARLGANTALIGCVGSDAAGRDCTLRFLEEGINRNSIQSCQEFNTGSAMIFVADDGENCIGISAGANAMLGAAAIAEKAPLIASADILLLQLETPIDGINEAVRIAKDNDTTIILNPAPAQPLEAALLAKVDILTPNETEAALLTEMDCNTLADAELCSQRLRDMGPDIVIITLGEAGALINDKGCISTVDAAVVSAIDTVGAGDTFNGALAVALSERKTLQEAAAFATKAAAIAVTRRGAQASIPLRSEISE